MLNAIFSYLKIKTSSFTQTVLEERDESCLDIFTAQDINFLRNDWLDFYNAIVDKEITYLYHFTDKANLKSIIKEGALYSRYQQEKRQVVPKRKGSNSISDQIEYEKKLQYYVHLSLTENHPMLHVAKNRQSIVNPVILKIDPRILLLKNSYFCKTNATRHDATVSNNLVDFLSIDFDLIKSNRWSGEDEKSRFQAEILIKGWVPTKYIFNIDQ